MTGFAFHHGPRLLCGEGISARIGEHLPVKDSGAPILFVTDAQVRGLGLADAALAAIGDRVTIFDAVEADPSRTTLEAAVAEGRRIGAAAVVGFGGGSPMDVAKLAAYLLGSGDDLDTLWGVGKAMGKGLPLVLVPTTAGTGSEATGAAIITLAGAEKQAVVSPALAAGLALLDPALTFGLPRAVTAATGMDAIVHAIEAFTTAHLKNPVSDMLAREALRLLTGNLLAACETPNDAAARAAMLLGAHLAGIAFANAPVAAVHALAYPLGGHFHVPHGLANTLMLPHVLDFTMAEARPLYAELGALVDPALAGQSEAAQADGLVAALRRLAAAARLPQRLRDVGVGAGDLDLLATDAMLQGRLLGNNRRAIALADARALYEAAL